MAGEFNVPKERLAEIAQSLLEIKKMARSIENSMVAFDPLVLREDTRADMDLVSSHANEIDATVTRLYKSIAKEAFSV